MSAQAAALLIRCAEQPDFTAASARPLLADLSAYAQAVSRFKEPLFDFCALVYPQIWYRHLPDVPLYRRAIMADLRQRAEA